MYSKYFPNISLYDDYDKTNKYIKEKYKVKLPIKLRKYSRYIKGEPKYLTYNFLDEFIAEVTYKDIEHIIQEVKGEKYEYKN